MRFREQESYGFITVTTEKRRFGIAIPVTDTAVERQVGARSAIRGFEFDK